jgi:cell division protease FtsH
MFAYIESYVFHGWRTIPKIDTSRRNPEPETETMSKSRYITFSQNDSFELIRKYPYSKHYYELALKRLNSKNQSIQDESILGNNPQLPLIFEEPNDKDQPKIEEYSPVKLFQIRRRSGFGENNQRFDDEEQENEDDDDDNFYKNKNKKSENFEVLTRSGFNFSDIGGYDAIKVELTQCIDMLKNISKYSKYNVRLPKGIILEGPPGNGKTLIAKGFAGESKTKFIAVSGAEFQEKYVGVGASRIRELFALAKKNVPCIVFIDEIDALGRRRSSDGETAQAERDSTLNELLIALDGFKAANGIFVIGATNRADLLDPALIRPGRIDKRIFIGVPDSKTRESILGIHIKGKPHDLSVVLRDLVEQTNGLSGAQIENLLNEAMLVALRENRDVFTSKDIDTILNRMMVGWQPTEHQFTNDMIDHIAIHEMGHAVVGMLSNNHANVSKVIINLSSPRSPAYTVFEASTSSIFTREALFEHLMILLSGRIAEEVIYDVTVTTGAINDFEEALKLAEKMVTYYGMGKKAIYPSMSDKYKEMIDEEVATLINDAYVYSEHILRESRGLIMEGAEILKRDKVMTAETLKDLVYNKYKLHKESFIEK